MIKNSNWYNTGPKLIITYQWLLFNDYFYSFGPVNIFFYANLYLDFWHNLTLRTVKLMRDLQ